MSFTAMAGNFDSDASEAAPEWTKLHETVAGQIAGFLGALADDDKNAFLKLLDEFLQARADKLGFSRAGLFGARRWIPTPPPKPHTEDSPPGPTQSPPQPWLGPPGLPPLTDAEMLATSFEPGEAWEELGSLWRSIRPMLQTTRGARRSAANDTLALIVVLTLLAERAAQSRDIVAFERAEEILSTQAGTLFALALRGAHAFERSQAGGTGDRTVKKGSDQELLDYAGMLLVQQVSPTNLTTEIRERRGGYFGVDDYLRRWLQGLGLIPKRAHEKPS